MMRTYASVVSKNPPPYNPKWAIGTVFSTTTKQKSTTEQQSVVKNTPPFETVSSPLYIEEWGITFFAQKGMTPINP